MTAGPTAEAAPALADWRIPIHDLPRLRPR
jgi:hypothetical protein